ncbi:MAG: hypothetical protein ABI462_02845 [Ignavibacteria bacterium]
MPENKNYIIIAKILFAVIFLITLAGCEENEKSKVNTDTIRKENSAPLINQTLFQGMSSGIETLTECSTNKKFIISPDGENQELGKAMAFFSEKKPNQPFYVEVEGFSSVRERTAGKGFDTILVITKFLKLDMARECE